MSLRVLYKEKTALTAIKSKRPETRSTAQSWPLRAPAFTPDRRDQDLTMPFNSVDDDEALARKLQEKYEQEEQQRRAARKEKGKTTTTITTTTNFTNINNNTMTGTSHHSNDRDLQSATSARNVLASARTSPIPVIDSTEGDEAMARRLQDELTATDEKKRASHSRYTRSTVASAPAERSRHNRSAAVRVDPPTAPSATAYENDFDNTTTADEAYAKKLQEEMNKRAERSRHSRTPTSVAATDRNSHPKAENSAYHHAATITPSLSGSLHGKNHRTAAIVDFPIVSENHHGNEHSTRYRDDPHVTVIDPPAARAALSEIPASPTILASLVDSASPTTSIITSTIADDELLARKLEQEMKDEELARRLSEEETKRRRRSSYLARKANNQKKKSDSIDGGLIEEEPAIRRVITDDGLEPRSKSLGRSSKSPPRGRSSKSPSRGRSSKSPSRGRLSKSPHRGRSRSTNRGQSVGMNNSQSPVRDSVAANRKRNVASVGVATATIAALGASTTMSSHRPEQPVGYQRGVSVIYDEDTSGHDDDTSGYADDIELALKLEQEDDDAALARQLANAEARRIAVIHQDAENRRSQWTCRRIVSLTIPIVIILAAVVGLVFAFAGGKNISRSGGTQPVFESGDPFKGITPGQANRWNNRNSGLTIQILNALNDQWDTYFQLAVQDWDNGTPDALTIMTEKVAADNACEPVQGKLKVCNGDYGDTKWRGINQVLLANGFIISSVAKLNEFYLATADESQRQYTMCHEMGHGFGLPHTDEDFYNADLGNCMDYTIHPEVNKHPDDTNYAFLVELYGVVPKRQLEDSNVEETIVISDGVKAIVRKIDPAKDCSPLHITKHSEEYWCNLGNNVTMVVSMLLMGSTQ